MDQLPIEAARELRFRLRDAHFTTFNTLNTIFTGGLVAFLLRQVLEMPAAQRPWLLVLASLLTLIACWSGLFRMLALVRFPSRMSDALLSFGAGAAVYVMVSLLDAGPQVWMRTSAAVAFFGGVGTLNMLRGARMDPFNDDVLPLIERDLRLAAWARLGFVPLMLLLAESGLPDVVLGAAAVAGAVLALVVDDVVWGRSVALTSRPDVLASERQALREAALLGERR
ncbi:MULTISPECIES: hypothetical protein [unclassified Roseateles]|uniref:hypothetical protein n=1 Tax=unclassified Roseateles TaxID=2626991 RepID=UPI0006FBDB09|nr:MULTISPECIES: hypothetical protein [unclassified Roseateles]KQW46403.1 hypothetical protein ASC81_08330 [Pelomonas sp. Root405]KRA73453.1 hypothetical protein ASD88_08330 [Pelomonas sp. Root662]